MKISFEHFLSLVFLLCSLNVWAGGHHTPASMPKEFNTLKKLVGTWEGKNKMGDKEESMTVVYKLTSGGTAITETMMPGTDHEMITVYYKEGSSLGMTHYCALGNQPHMALEKATDNSLFFDMKKPVGISSLNESHMHSLKITMNDVNSITQEWTNFEDGKKAQSVVFNLKRK
jgi:hypothetical protein